MSTEHATAIQSLALRLRSMIGRLQR
jgi:hypothetical protein